MSSNPNALTVILPDEWRVMTQQAEALVGSGFLPQSVNTVQKAVAIMTLGRELGIGAWAALSSVNVIQQKPTVSPQLMLALINRSGQLEDMLMSDDGQACTVTMKRRGRTPHTHVFSMQDAAAMGLANKDNWKKQPAIMRQWRAVAACARVVFADVVLGLYTPEEMGADVIADEQGNMTIVRVERDDARQLQSPTDEPVVTVEQASASVIGAGLPKPIQPQEEVIMRPDGTYTKSTETPPNLHYADALIVSMSNSAKQFALRLKSGAVVALTEMALLDGLTIGDTPVQALERRTYPLNPHWRVSADHDVDGWRVDKIEQALPV